MGMRYSRGRRRNPRVPSVVLWGAAAVGAYFLWKKLGGAIDGVKANASAAAVGDLPPGKEYMRYRAVKRGSSTVCYDIETEKVVDNSLCEAEMLRGVGGVFGGGGTLG